MKIQKTISTFLATLLLCSSLFAEKLPQEESLLTNEDFSFLLKELGQPGEEENFSFSFDKKESLTSKANKWATYKQTIGIEKIQIKFPNVPAVAKENNILFTYCPRKKTLYSMVAGMPPIGGIKTKEAFPIVLASLCQHPNYLLGHKITQQDGYNILDTTSEDYQTGIITKARMIITKRNFYILRTAYPAGSREDHEYFLNSLSITY